MLSRSTGYALQALVHLAAQPPGRLAGAREIAAATGAPMPFLWKILRNLSRDKLIRSTKGVRGGYELSRPANQITLRQVAELTQRENPATRCVLGSPVCDPDHPCLLHATWSGIRENVDTIMLQTTIADLIPKIAIPGAKIRRSRKRKKK